MLKALTIDQTLQSLIRAMDSSGRVVYTRFGDGDLVIINGRKTVVGRQKATPYPELRNELTEAIAVSHPHYLKGFSVDWEKEPGMGDMVLGPWKSKEKCSNIVEKYTDLSQPIYSPYLFHYLAMHRQRDFWNFIDKRIASRPKMFIGSVDKKSMDKMFGGIDVYVKTPESNSYETISSWWQDIEQHLDSVEVVLPCAGFSSRVIAHRIWQMETDHHILDFGSVPDAYVGIKSRSWIALGRPSISR